MKRRILLDRRGVSAVIIASMFLIILTFSTLALLLSGFFGYNMAVNEEMKIEQERAQEKVILILTPSDIQNIANQTCITSVRVNNTGTITVRIRAIYETNRTMTVFLGDPSTWMESTYIQPNEQLRITPPLGRAYITLFRPSAKLILATERGTKTSDYEGPMVFGPSKPPQPYEPSKYYIGPLELMFTAFYYRLIDSSSGNYIEPNWHPGWSIPKSYGYVAWNITVRNIDNRNITINRFSSFTVVPNESPPSDERTWYLDTSTQPDQTLLVGKLDHIVYKWVFPYDPGVKAQNIYSVSCRCLVFLTFYGVFHEPDGSTTVYAQTIPFEAAITVI